MLISLRPPRAQRIDNVRHVDTVVVRMSMSKREFLSHPPAGSFPKKTRLL